MGSPEVVPRAERLLALLREQTYATDLDGTIYDLLGGIISHLRDHHNIHKQREDVTSYNLAGFTGDELADRAIINLFSDPRFYFNLRPMPGAVEAMRRLREHGRIVAVTSRPVNAHIVTKLALARDFGLGVIDERVYFTKAKARECQVLRARAMFEDHPETAQKVAAKGIRTYLLSSPYMGEVRRSRHLRVVSSISEAVADLTAPVGV